MYGSLADWFMMGNSVEWRHYSEGLLCNKRRAGISEAAHILSLEIVFLSVSYFFHSFLPSCPRTSPYHPSHTRTRCTRYMFEKNWCSHCTTRFFFLLFKFHFVAGFFSLFFSIHLWKCFALIGDIKGQPMPSLSRWPKNRSPCNPSSITTLLPSHTPSALSVERMQTSDTHNTFYVVIVLLYMCTFYASSYPPVMKKNPSYVNKPIHNLFMESIFAQQLRFQPRNPSIWLTSSRKCLHSFFFSILPASF